MNNGNLFMSNNTEIWLNEKLMTASFHMEDGFAKQNIESLQQFVYLMQKLVEQGYRFQ